jgi:hypothetical protein
MTGGTQRLSHFPRVAKTHGQHRELLTAVSSPGNLTYNMLAGECPGMGSQVGIGVMQDRGEMLVSACVQLLPFSEHSMHACRVNRLATHGAALLAGAMSRCSCNGAGQLVCVARMHIVDERDSIFDSIPSASECLAVEPVSTFLSSWPDASLNPWQKAINALAHSAHSNTKREPGIFSVR